MKVTLSTKEFHSLTEKKKKNCVKLLKKTCRTRCFTLYAGVDATFGEYKGLIYTLGEMQNDKVSGSTASGPLKQISHYEFVGTLYVLINILPCLTRLSKTFKQEGSTFQEFHLPLTDANQKSLKRQKVIQSFSNLKKI